MHVVERYAAWATGWRAQPIADEVTHHARRAVIDWHAALYPGLAVPPATLLKRAFTADDARTVALIHGSAAHTVEVDDIYRDGIYHPGAPTIAAAHGLGFERRNFLRAVFVGYEILTRIGAAMGRAHYRYWHNTGTIGCFGACAAAAELLQLDARRFAHALATVTTFAAGLQQAFRMDSMSKPLHAGRAAEAGVTAALAASEGIIGSLNVLEGDSGYGRAMGEGDGPDWERALATLGKDFHITRMTFKNKACCGHVFAAIDGALALQQQMRVLAPDIERISIGTYKAALDVARHESPRTAAEARFSLKYTVASALTHGSVRLAAFEPSRLGDPVTRELMRRIDVAIDPELDAAFPAQRAARITIESRDGRRGEHLQPTRKGDPEAPLSDTELEHKYLELASPVLGEGRARELLARLWCLEREAQLELGYPFST